METVAKFINPEEAKVVRSFLASHGIDAFINGEEALSVMPHLTMGSASAYHVMVAEEDEAQAKRLLEEVERQHMVEKADTGGTGFTKKQFFLTAALFVTVLAILIGNSRSNELDLNAYGGYAPVDSPCDYSFHRFC